MRPGRLLLLSDYFGADGAATGGAGVAAQQSFEILQRLGARADLVSGYFTPEALGGRPDVLTLGGEDLRAAGSTGSALRALYNGEARRRLAPMLAGYDPQETVVVLHQWTRWLSPAALGLLKPYRLMVYMHDYFWLCPNGAYYDFRAAGPCTRRPMSPQCLASACDRAGYSMKLARVARQALKSLLTGADAGRRMLLHVSERSLALGERLAPGERHRLVHNPLPSAVPPGPPPPAEPLHDLGYFGRLEPEKGTADLAEAAARLGLSALFVGSGSMADALRARLGPAAVVDWAAPADALALMGRCRTVVLPSRWPETWGLVTAEALALGRPVVVSARAGSASLVERFGGGQVYDPGEAGALDAALRAVLDRPPGPAAAASTAERVRRALSPEAHGRRILELAREAWGLDATAARAEMPEAA